MIGKTNNKIINPFAPKKGVLTLEVDLQTGQTSMKVTPQLPIPMLIGIMLQTASNLVGEWAKLDSMLVNPTHSTEPIETFPKGEADDKKENSDN